MNAQDFLNLAASFVTCDNGINNPLETTDDLEDPHVTIWEPFVGMPMGDLKEHVEILSFQFKKTYQLGMIMSAAFWYDLLTEDQRLELRREYNLAKDAKQEEFKALNQMWDVRYVTYLYEHLSNRDAKNKR
jgi:hypothetical protein